MTLNKELKEAAAPWVEVFAQAIKQCRQGGYTDEQITAALEQLERDNADKIDGDVMVVVMGELRKAAGL
jgi:hypothetical protein